MDLSDDESSDSDLSSPKPANAPKTRKPKVKGKGKSPLPESVSSQTLSTASDAGANSSGEGDFHAVVNTGAVKNKEKPKDASMAESESDADSDNVVEGKPGTKSTDDTSSSSSDSESSESESESTSAPTNQKSATTTGLSPATASLGEVRATKKRRTSESGAAIATATITLEERAPDTPQLRINGTNGKPGRKVNTPFRRVDPDKVPVTSLMDNRYIQKVRFNSRGFVSILHATSRPGRAMIMVRRPMLILSSHEALDSGRRKTRKRGGVIVAARSL